MQAAFDVDRILCLILLNSNEAWQFTCLLAQLAKVGVMSPYRMLASRCNNSNPPGHPAFSSQEGAHKVPRLPSPSFPAFSSGPCSSQSDKPAMQGTPSATDTGIFPPGVLHPAFLFAGCACQSAMYSSILIAYLPGIVWGLHCPTWQPALGSAQTASQQQASAVVLDGEDSHGIETQIITRMDDLNCFASALGPGGALEGFPWTTRV